MDPVKIRNDFPFLKNNINGRPLIYFDNAATTHKPQSVLDTINKFYIKYNAAVNRSIHDAGNTAGSMYWQAHENVARFIGAGSSREIIFTRNSTEAVNLVCHSLMQGKEEPVVLASGDEIILTVSEHHSNFVPWQRLQDSCGIKLRITGISPDGRADPDQIRSLVTEKTRLICCTHVSNVFGVINPVSEIGLFAKEAGALFLVDGTQSAPHIKVDVKKIGCDFFVFSGHKMLAPTGIGILYGRKELLEKMPPFLSGGGMIKEVSLEKITWNDLPWKFEAGTPDVCGAVALGGAFDPKSGEKLPGAVDYLNSIGMDDVHTHEHDLCSYTMSGLEKLDGVVMYVSGSCENRCGIISFNIIKNKEIIDSHIIAHFLNEEGIAVRSGGHCAYPLMKYSGINGSVRISFYIYNTRDEVDIFLNSLDNIIKKKLI
jgi:cysteine desulfurase / selenocysteine lyase